MSTVCSRLRCRLILAVLACGFVLPVRAGIRGPGKYCGVVIFDRWDNCLLLSGPFITYVSESVKNGLRSHSGRAVQLDASDVVQPMDPGDALIRKYTIIGPAPDTHHSAVVDGLELFARGVFGPRGTATFVIEIRNVSSNQIEINSQEIGPVLLTTVFKFPFKVSDGPSMAVITRVHLSNDSVERIVINGVTRSWSYTIDPQTRPPGRIQLNPGQSLTTRLTFEAPPGQYQFMFGYGGGVHEEKSLASNAISFDLSADGVATLVQ
jgi:hypothetical protein